MIPKFIDLASQHNIVADRDSLENYVNAIIEECVFAILINYEGKINPMSLKEMIEEHLGINEF